METAQVVPFLTFNGNAEEAMNFYVTVFPDTAITVLQRYGNSPHITAGQKDRILMGQLSLMGKPVMFLDMDQAYPAPGFTWSSSLFVTCRSEEEFDAVFAGLANEGEVMMGPEAVEPFRKCAWITDRFGVTWQPAWE